MQTFLLEKSRVVATTAKGALLTTYHLLTTSYFLLPTYYLLLTTFYFLLPTSHFPLPTSHFPLPIPGERNYHVFYHVLLGARLLSPPDPKQHRLLSRSACYAIPHVDDAEEHRLLVQAMVCM